MNVLRTGPVAPLGSAASAFPLEPPVAEQAWSDWAASLDALQPEAWRRVVVVAPHPDDETLGCGGLIRDLTGRGVDVRVVTVTDGEGSHRGWPDLGVQRRQEQREALAAFGLAKEPTFLGLPDGHVADHEHELFGAMAPLCDGADVVLAPWAQDGHADHDAVGRVATRVGRLARLVVLAHPIWAWQWARFDDLVGPPWQRWTLTAEARRAKAVALTAYRSQTSDEYGPPVLGPEMVDRARRGYEVFARVG